MRGNCVRVLCALLLTVVLRSFQDVTAIIFVVALSEYNLKLEEDLVTNRMMESLKLFNDVVNNRWFAATNVILFLNKKDIFATKIRTVPLTVCFADYTGPSEYDAALKFINEKFQSKLDHVCVVCERVRVR